MSTVESFKTELMAMQSLPKQQSSVVSSQDFDKLLHAQCEAFAQKINKVAGLDVESVFDLTTVVQQGVWSASQKSKLTLALGTALSLPAGSDGNTEEKKKRTSQEINGIQNYVLAAEAEILKAPDIAWTAKLNTMMSVMKRIVLILPSETSKGHIFKIMLAACPAFMQGLDYDTSREKCLELTRKIHLTFKNTKEAGSMGYISNYPDHPSGLHESQIEVMFGGQNPVVLIDNKNAMAVATDLTIPRGNSQKLSKNQQQKQLSICHGAPAQPQSGMQEFAACMMNMMRHMNTPSGPPTIPLQFFGNGSQGQQSLQHGRDHVMTGGAGTSLALTAGSTTLALTDKSPTTPSNVLKGMSAGSSDSLQLLQHDSPKDDMMSPADQAERFLNAMKATGEDTEPTSAPAAKKGGGKAQGKSMKAQPKQKAAAVTPTKKTTKAVVATPDKIKSKGITFKPKVEWEATRNQWLCRVGVPKSVCGEGSSIFSVAQYGSKAAAKKHADAWLKKFKTTHKCA